MLRDTMASNGLPDIDVYVLKRMYDYVGHLTRAVHVNPGHLTGLVMTFRAADWKYAMSTAVGHQGHRGRVAPWTWERQYSSYYNSIGISWREAAKDRQMWQLHRRPWLEAMLGRRVAATNMGDL